MQHRITKSKVLNVKPTIASKFISTCFNCGKLGRTKSKYHKLLVSNNKQDITNRIRILTNQFIHLTEMITYLTKIAFLSRRVWVKKSELTGENEELNYGIAHVALKTKNDYVTH